MRKILLVIQREYFTRVKKKSFWILTIIVPFLVVLLYAIPFYLASKPIEHSNVLVVDETGLFQHAFHSSDDIAYRDAGSLDYAKRQLAEVDSINAIVFIPARETSIPRDAFLYYRTGSPSPMVQGDVESQLQSILHNKILLDVHNISREDYNLITNTKIHLRTQDLETGRDGFLEVKMVAGVLLALIIFFAIFMFCGQIMQGVSEEKQSRIIEIIISSIKPFQLMMGKVIGIGLVGLTQFFLWLLLSGGALLGVQAANADKYQQALERQNITELATKGVDATEQMEALQSAEPVSELIQGLTAINFPLLIGMFLFFFLFGYLLYASLFAACGALVDQGTDSQSFSLPITIPLLLTFLLLPAMIQEPSGTLATWLSIIPFTSPVAMLVRIPFGVPIYQLVLSIVLMLATFPLCIWVAAKIYRTAILLYGKKITWKDLFGWIRQRD